MRGDARGAGRAARAARRAARAAAAAATTQARANRLKTDWDARDDRRCRRSSAGACVDAAARGARAVHRLDVLLRGVGAEGPLPGDPRPPAVRRGRARALRATRRRCSTASSREQRLTARGVYGFWPADADGDDIVVYADDARRAELARFHMLRQQEAIADGRPNRSLADFVAPTASLAPDYIGAFAVTAGIGADELAQRVRARARRLQRDHGQGAGRSAGRGVRRVPARAGAAGLGLRRAARR